MVLCCHQTHGKRPLAFAYGCLMTSVWWTDRFIHFHSKKIHMLSRSEFYSTCERKWKKNFVMYSQTKVDPDNNPGSEFGARLRRSLGAFRPKKRREDRRSGSRQKFSFLQPQGLQWLDMKKTEEELERPDFVKKQTDFGSKVDDIMHSICAKARDRVRVETEKRGIALRDRLVRDVMTVFGSMMGRPVYGNAKVVDILDGTLFMAEHTLGRFPFKLFGLDGPTISEPLGDTLNDELRKDLFGQRIAFSIRFLRKTFVSVDLVGELDVIAPRLLEQGLCWVDEKELKEYYQSEPKWIPGGKITSVDMSRNNRLKEYEDTAKRTHRGVWKEFSLEQARTPSGRKKKEEDRPQTIRSTTASHFPRPTPKLGETPTTSASRLVRPRHEQKATIHERMVRTRKIKLLHQTQEETAPEMAELFEFAEL
eukprot:TRINITY_DN1294_c0_g2_i2.p1 TRINITY_DN1294_c0_g2~~TRINITY_DN1294_c0_g2_i2.p1  ORF type:complete len:422 (+),score=105.08 TRINITY_DN1294_c0_g2_i2:424-1689(+)